MWFNERMENFRQWRSRNFAAVGKVFVRLHLSANILTTLALLCGLVSVYFLFQTYWLFVLFGILHIFFDSMDGVVARLTKPSRFGHFYDICCDRLIELLFLVKVGYVLQDYFAYLVVGITLLAQIFFFMSREQAPILFTRTLVFVMLVIPLSFSPILAYLCSGVASMFVLARQLQWVMMRKG